MRGRDVLHDDAVDDHLDAAGGALHDGHAVERVQRDTELAEDLRDGRVGVGDLERGAVHERRRPDRAA